LDAISAKRVNYSEQPYTTQTGSSMLPHTLTQTILNLQILIVI